RARLCFFFSSRRRHTRSKRDWSSDVCSSDLEIYSSDELLGYAYQTIDVVDIPAYSGKPINLQVVLDPQGVIKDAYVLNHEEPIQIGRASCRERVKSSVVAEVLEGKEEDVRKV